jgi:thiol-disulfide isomerase/thioredoxin
MLFILCIITSCNNSPYAIISGKVNSQIKKLTLKTQYETYKIALDENNFFSDSLELDEGYCYLIINNQRFQIYLKPNSHLNINIGDNLTFSGNEAPINRYLYKQHNFTKKIQHLENSKYISNLSEKQFLSLADSINNKRIEILETHKSNFDFDFINIETKRLFYVDKHQKSIYVTTRKIFKNKTNISKDYRYKLYDKIDLELYQLVNDYHYLNFVDSYLWDETKKLTDNNDSFDFYNEYMNLLNSKISNKLIKEEISYLIGNIKLGRSKQIDSVYIKVNKNLINPNYKKRIALKYEALKKIEKGKISPNFKLVDKHNKLVNLQNLKGKFVYIDIWSSYCPPCMAELPHLKKLQTKYINKNIYFVGINVGNKHTEWLKLIKDHKLEGIQLHAPNTKIPFFKDYQVRGIPRFILLDKNGNIVESNAKRPSDKELILQLNSLLNN